MLYTRLVRIVKVGISLVQIIEALILYTYAKRNVLLITNAKKSLIGHRFYYRKYYK